MSPVAAAPRPPRPRRAARAEPPAAAARAPIFLPYQVAWIRDESTIAICEKSRRIGMDWTEAFRAVRERFSGERVVDYWYSSADESAAAEFMQYVRVWARDVCGAVLEIVTGVEPFEGRDVKVMSVALPEVRGRRPRITAMASNPKSFRSKGGDVCLSEFAFHENAEELWKACAPVTMWGGRIRVLSTHHGIGSYFNVLLAQARRRADPAIHGAPSSTDVRASLHRVTIYDAIGQGLVDRINAVSGRRLTREEFVEAERAKCGSELAWREEYECEPSDQNESFLPYALLRPFVSPAAAAPTDSLGEFLAAVAERSRGADSLHAGCDVGRRRDAFVIWVISSFGGMRRTTGVLALRDAPWATMEAAIAGLMGIDSVDGQGRRTEVRRLAIDETGMGMQLAERARLRYGYRVEPVTFTASVKEDLATRVRRSVEERTITLPDDPAVLADFTAIRRVVTAAGAVRFDGERTADGHSDRFWACALALSAQESGRGSFGMWRVSPGRGL